MSIQEILSWDLTQCPQFEDFLYHHAETNVYKSGGKIIDKNDPRLIDYLEMSKRMVPVNLFQ